MTRRIWFPKAIVWTVFSSYLISASLAQIAERSYSYPMNLVMLGAHGRGLANLTSLVRKSEEIRGLGLTTHSFDEAIIMFSIGNVSHQLLLKDTRFPELGMYYVILAGRNIEAQRDCMVGRVWADAAGISLGSTVDILGSEYNVVGVTHHTYTASDVPAPVFVIPASSLSSVLSSAERCAVRELAYQFCVVLAFKSVRSLDRLADSILRRAPGMELERYPRQNLADLPNREALAFGTLRICLFLLLVGSLLALHRLGNDPRFFPDMLLGCAVGFAVVWAGFLFAQAIIGRPLSSGLCSSLFSAFLACILVQVARTVTRWSRRRKDALDSEML